MPEREDQRTRDDDLDDIGGLDGGLGDDIDGLDDVGGSGDLEGDVGLDRDPSEQYGDLVDDGDDGGGLLGGIGSDSDTPSAGESGAEAEDEGFLSGFFGSDDLDSSEADDGDSRLGGFFSGRAFLAILVGCTVLAGLGATLVPFVGPLVGAPAGLFVGTFLAGLIGSKRRYLEAGLTGSALGLAVVVGDALPRIVTDNASPTVAIATMIGLGLAVAVLGLYFGRDLRAGVTADVGEE